MNENYGRETNVVTPEYVRLQFHTAGLGSRAGAQLIDVAIMAAVFGIVFALISMVMSFAGMSITDWSADYAIALIILFTFVLIGGYFIVMEYYFGGQTPGKRAMGLRTIQQNGQPLTFVSAVIRNVVRLIDFLPSFYLLGSVWMFFHPQDKRLGDIAAGTLVVRDMRAVQRRHRRKADKWIRKRLQPLPELNLSQDALARLDREQWQLITTFVERMPILHPSKRDELALRVARQTAAHLHLDEPAFAGNPSAFLAAVYLQLADEWNL